MYLLVLHGPGSLFYPFAVLALVGGPSVAAIVAALHGQDRLRAGLAAGATVFGSVVVLFFLTYTVWPQFQGTSVRLPDFCTDEAGLVRPPPAVAYEVPGYGRGILLAKSAETAVAEIAAAEPPHVSNVFVIDTIDRRVVKTLTFPNDVVMATVDDGIAYIYNDKLGFFLDARTGELKPTFLTMDNYSGMSRVEHPVLPNTPGNAWYVERDAIISSWGVDGSVRSLPHMFLNATARGCYIDGETGRVTRLLRDY